MPDPGHITPASIRANEITAASIRAAARRSQDALTGADTSEHARCVVCGHLTDSGKVCGPCRAVPGVLEAVVERAERLEEALADLDDLISSERRKHEETIRRAEQAEAAIARAQEANRRLRAALIASAHLLDVPYTNAPDQTPWTRSIKPAMHVLKAALDGAGAVPEEQPDA